MREVVARWWHQLAWLLAFDQSMLAAAHINVSLGLDAFSHNILVDCDTRYLPGFRCPHESCVLVARMPFTM